MSTASFYEVLLLSQYGFGVITLVSLFFTSAPYGRFVRQGWGPTVKALYGWVVMESAAVITITLWFFFSDYNPVALLMLLIWETHYIRRTFVYPFRMKGRNKPFPILLVFFALTFNIMNGYINGYYIFQVGQYDINWLYDWRFILGIAVFYAGYAINTQSDTILSRLGKSEDGGYQVPHGGLFKYVSCPHYLGEIIEWTGWALLTWSPAGLAFAFYTFANLAPRAISHHKWYRKEFPEYPSERKALIPYIW